MLELYRSGDHTPAAIDVNVEKEPATMDYRITRAVATVYGIKEVSELWKMVKRQKRMKRMIRIGAAVVLMALGVGLYMKYGYTTTRYYSNYVLRNHIPYGVNRIPASKIHTYWHYVKIQTRGGKVRHYEICNNSDTPDDKLPFEPTFAGTIVDLEYDDQTGKVSKLKEVDRNKVVNGITIVYSDSLIGVNKEDGEYATAGTSLGTQSNFSFCRLRRNERGEVVGIYFLPDNKTPVSDATPYIFMERNEQGLVTLMDQSHVRRVFNGESSVYHLKYDLHGLHSVENWDVNRQPVAGKNGVCKTVVEGQGTPRLSIAYFDQAGRPCLGHGAVHKIERQIQYLKDRQLFFTQTFFYDTENRLMDSNLGVSRIDAYFNQDESSLALSYYDRNGHPVCQKDGYHTFTYHRTDTVSVSSYFDLAGNYTLHNEEGIARDETRYSENRVEVTFYNEQLKPCNNKEEKAGKIIYKTDSEGRIVYKGSFLDSGFPVWIEACPPVVCMEYDERGNRARIRFEDGHGRPAMCEYGYAEVRSTYDDFGCEISQEYFDSAGKPVDTAEGYSKEVITYLEQGLGRKYAFFTKDGKYRCPYAKRVEYVNEKNRVVREEKRDSSDRLVKIDGWAVFQQEYASDGVTIIHGAYYDENERPCRGEGGIYQFFYKYDPMGNKISTRYRDSADLPVLYNGFSLFKYRYNVKKQLLESEAVNEFTQENVRTVYSYSDDDRTTKVFQYKNNRLTGSVETYLDSSKRVSLVVVKDAYGNLTREKGQPAYKKVVRFPNNLIKEISFRDYRNKLMIPKNHSYAQLIEKDFMVYYFYNADSLLTSAEYGFLDEMEEIVMPIEIEGVSKKRWLYKDTVEIVSFYNKADQLCMTMYGYAYEKKTKNRNNEVIRVEYLDTLARPCNATCPEGTYAICDWEYDENHIPIHISFRDADGALVDNKKGYSSQDLYRYEDSDLSVKYVRIRKNKRGYITSESLLTEEDGKLFYMKEPVKGVSEVIITYDSLYRLVAERSYDAYQNLYDAQGCPEMYVRYKGKSMVPLHLEFYSLKGSLESKQTFEFADGKLTMYLFDSHNHLREIGIGDYSNLEDTLTFFTKAEMIKLNESSNFTWIAYDDSLRKYTRKTKTCQTGDIVTYGITPKGDTLLIPSLPYYLEVIKQNIFIRKADESD